MKGTLKQNPTKSEILGLWVQQKVLHGGIRGCGWNPSLLSLPRWLSYSPFVHLLLFVSKCSEAYHGLISTSRANSGVGHNGETSQLHAPKCLRSDSTTSSSIQASRVCLPDSVAQSALHSVRYQKAEEHSSCGVRVDVTPCVAGAPHIKHAQGNVRHIRNLYRPVAGTSARERNCVKGEKRRFLEEENRVFVRPR